MEKLSLSVLSSVMKCVHYFHEKSITASDLFFFFMYLFLFVFLEKERTGNGSWSRTAYSLTSEVFSQLELALEPIGIGLVLNNK